MKYKENDVVRIISVVQCGAPSYTIGMTGRVSECSGKYCLVFVDSGLWTYHESDLEKFEEIPTTAKVSTPPISYDQLNYKLQVEKAISALSKCVSTGQPITHRQAQDLINELLDGYSAEAATVQGLFTWDQHMTALTELRKCRDKPASVKWFPW